MGEGIISHWRGTECQRGNQTADMSNVSEAQYTPLMLFWGILWIYDSPWVIQIVMPVNV